MWTISMSRLPVATIIIIIVILRILSAITEVLSHKEITNWCCLDRNHLQGTFKGIFVFVNKPSAKIILIKTEIGIVRFGLLYLAALASVQKPATRIFCLAWETGLKSNNLYIFGKCTNGSYLIYFTSLILIVLCWVLIKVNISINVISLWTSNILYRFMLWIMYLGASINYVSKILPIFDPLPPP